MAQIGDIKFQAGAYGGLSETLSQIEAGELAPTVNGRQVFLGDDSGSFHKYRYSLSGDVVRFPAGLTRLWVGDLVSPVVPDDIVLIELVAAGESSIRLERIPDSGSLVIYAAADAAMTPITAGWTRGGRDLTFAAPATEDLVVEYVPVFSKMRVEAAPSLSASRTRTTRSWSLTLIETSEDDE